MLSFSTSDMVILALVGFGAFYFIFKDSLFAGSSAGPAKLGNGTANGKIGPAGPLGAGAGQGSGVPSGGRDLAKSMKLAVSGRCGQGKTMRTCF